MPSRASSSVLTRRRLRRGRDSAHFHHALAERAAGLEVDQGLPQLLEPVRRSDRRRDRAGLDHREQGAPLLVLGRTAEPLGVILEAIPFDEEQIAARVLDTTRKAERLEAGHRRDDLLGPTESVLERRLLIGDDVEDRVLEDHERRACPLR